MDADLTTSRASMPVTRVCIGALVLATAGLLLVTGWLSDDAFITLRVADNVWAGYGLRWNALERVQVFTHPLWMLVLAAAYGVTREAYWTTIAVSMACSTLAIVLVAGRVALHFWGAVAALALVAASKAVVEFSTSGLENPLSHALLIAFLLALWDARARPAALDRAAFLAGLCVLCRLDLFVLVGPPLAVAMLRTRGAGVRRLLGLSALAVAPILAWWMFAFVYFGSIWPNTALAKLPSNVGLGERVPQGLRYLVDAAIADPITVVVLVAAIARAWWRDTERALAVALIGAIGYVVAVGGDFMTGRFLSAPAIVAIAILARHVDWTPHRAAAVAAAALTIGLAMPQSPLRVWRQPRAGDALVSHGHGILDERAVYAPYTGVVPVLTRGVHPRDHPWARGGRDLGGVPRVATFEAVGLLGYFAGPGLHIVDPMALTDPFLARLPADRPWRIGHFRRTLPDGYAGMLDACVANAFPGHAVAPPVATCLDVPEALKAMPAPEGEKFQRIAAVTQLPLWNARRLAALGRGGL